MGHNLIKCARLEEKTGDIDASSRGQSPTFQEEVRPSMHSLAQAARANWRCPDDIMNRIVVVLQQQADSHLFHLAQLQFLFPQNSIDLNFQRFRTIILAVCQRLSRIFCAK